ncbi:hypothetical protein ACHAXA_003851 [Cyclostephanos tholiformis]|uniref:Uncharacterized protein n=1 Tax=Cyclostephanos tholiformis TaxID=382380 RepID=A0ABD3R6G5_9STRA
MPMSLSSLYQRRALRQKASGIGGEAMYYEEEEEIMLSTSKAEKMDTVVTDESYGNNDESSTEDQIILSTPEAEKMHTVVVADESYRINDESSNKSGEGGEANEDQIILSTYETEKMHTLVPNSAKSSYLRMGLLVMSLCFILID